MKTLDLTGTEPLTRRDAALLVDAAISEQTAAVVDACNRAMADLADKCNRALDDLAETVTAALATERAWTSAALDQAAKGSRSLKQIHRDPEGNITAIEEVPADLITEG